jgi:phosphate starvation-inducible PhoH-like protein
MTVEKTVPLEQELVNIFGVNDQNLIYLKSLFPDLDINVRGNIIYINGSSHDTKEATRILDEMLLMGSKNKIIEIPDLELIAKIKNPEKLSKSKVSQLNVIDNKFIKVKNINQFKYLETIDESTVTFGIGPAGTGKTFLAVASAVKMYSENNIKK